MAKNTQVNGVRIKKKVGEVFGTPVEISTLETLIKGLKMDMVFITSIMVIVLRGNGLMG